MEINKEVKRSALRYFGGKWAIAPWIIEHMPEHRVYVEPFGGAASVLLRKPRSKVEVYNDLDDEIVGIFRVLQDPLQCRELVRRLKRTPYARREFEIAFLATSNPIIRAQRAIIRAYMSFHHTALFNPGKNTFADARHRKAGNHCKAHEWASYPRHLASICRRLRGVLIEHRDALDIIRVQDTPDALFFVDPPYVHSTRDASAKYRCELDDDQHVALLTLLRGAAGQSNDRGLRERSVRRSADRLAALHPQTLCRRRWPDGADGSVVDQALKLFAPHAIFLQKPCETTWLFGGAARYGDVENITGAHHEQRTFPRRTSRT